MKLLNSPVYDYVDDILREDDVHDVQRIPLSTPGNASFVVFAVLLTLVHGFILYLLLGTDIWPAIPILLHIIVAGITVMITYGQYRRGLDVQHLGALAIVSATTGIFGTLGALVGFIAYIIFRQKNQHFADWYESIFPTDHVSQSQQIYDDILEGLDEHPTMYNVMSFNDVMRLGSEDQKRRALTRMTTRFHPRLSSAFKIALKDPSNAIRVQAATAIAKIERHFMQVNERIVEARARDTHNSKLLYAQARFYDDYAFTGILDSELEKQNRKRALDSYRAYLQQDPNHAETWAAVGRILQRSGDFSGATEWLQQAIARGVNMKTMYLWYFEGLFAQKKFDELRQAAARHGREALANDELPQPLRDAIALWMHQAA